MISFDNNLFRLSGIAQNDSYIYSIHHGTWGKDIFLKKLEQLLGTHHLRFQGQSADAIYLMHIFHAQKIVVDMTKIIIDDFK